MSLWKHQEEAIAWAVGRRDCVFHVGMGAGKSRIAIEVMLREIMAHPSCRILIGCPRAVKPAWAKQFALWAPHVRVLVLEKGTAKDKEKQVKAALADTTPLVIVGNYETLWRMPVLEKTKFDVLVWDEVHRLKAPSGSASKWAFRLGKANPTAKRIALSGTLLAHSPLDAFGTYRAIEGPECPTFGHSYTLFKARYAIENPHVRGMVVGFRNQEEMARKIAGTTFYRRTCDVLDLPPLLFDELGFDLTGDEARIYREVETEFCAICENGTVTPANAMVAVLRLAQICGGFVRYDESTVASPITDAPAKASRFGEFLEDLDPREKLVVFCRFRSDIDSVIGKCVEHARTYSELSGRIDRLAEWQSGKTSVLIAQIQSGGIGIDCTAASYGVFYSVGYSLSEYEQAIARLHRPGQERTTRIYTMIATVHNTPTIERRIYNALRERKDVVDAIVNQYRGNQHALHGAR